MRSACPPGADPPPRGACGVRRTVRLAIIEGLGRGVVAASVALGAGLVAWSLTGLRPGRADERLGDAATLGLALLTVALAALAAVSALGTSGGLGATAGLGVAVGAFGVAGVGMGLAYPRLTAEAFDALPAELASRVAMAVGFAEVTGTAVGSLLGGGLYSLAGSLGVDAGSSISAAFAVLTAAAATAGLVSARRGQRARTPAGAA